MGKKEIIILCLRCIEETKYKPEIKGETKRKRKGKVKKGWREKSDFYLKRYQPSTWGWLKTGPGVSPSHGTRSPSSTRSLQLSGESFPSASPYDCPSVEEVAGGKLAYQALGSRRNHSQLNCGQVSLLLWEEVHQVQESTTSSSHTSKILGCSAPPSLRQVKDNHNPEIVQRHQALKPYLIS